MSKQVKYLNIVLIAFLNLKINAQQSFNNYYQSGKLSMAVHTQTLLGNQYLLSAYFKDSLTEQQGIEFRKINQQGITVLRKRYVNGIEDIGSFFSNCVVLEDLGPNFYFTSGTSTGTNNSVYIAAINKNSLDTLWTKIYYNSAYNYYMNSIFKVKPNEIWLVGTKGSQTTILTPIAIKYDTLGNLLSIKEFTNYTNYDCLSITFNKINSTVIIAGNNFNTNPSSFEITCIDTTGNIIWTNNYSNEGFWIKEMMVTGNDLYTCGSAVPSFPGNTNILELRKFNVNTGAQIFKKNYGKISFGNTFYAIDPTSDGNIILTGNYTSTYYASITGRHDALILKVKPNGDSLWARIFNMFPNTSSNAETFFDIRQTPDNGFIACGAPIYVPIPQSQSWVVKTDSLGIAPGAITVNLNEQELKEFNTSVYPNPFKTSIQVNTNTSLKLNLRVIDILGKLQHTQNLSQATTKIDLEFLPPGIYFISISTEQGQSKTIKLVKE